MKVAQELVSETNPYVVLYCQLSKKSVCNYLVNRTVFSMTLYQWPNTKYRIEYITNPGHTNFLTDAVF